MNPCVSVLLPVRDCDRFLGQALRSMRQQSFQDLEIVCVDDGSRDETPVILAAHAAADGRLRVIRTARSGIVAALNTGLGHCTGRYIARMDADDVSHRERLSCQVNALDEEREVAVMASRVRAFPASATRRGMRDYLDWSNRVLEPEIIAREILVECPVVHPSALIRRDALDAVGGYRSGNFPEDYDLWLRMHRAGYRFRKLPQVLHAWREREERLTRTHPMYERARFLDLKADHIRSLVEGQGRAVVMVGAGVVGKPLARRLLGLGVRLAAFLELNPRKIGLRIHGAPVLHPDDLVSLRGCLFLAAVSARNQRDVVREDLEARGLREGRDFLCVV